MTRRAVARPEPVRGLFDPPTVWTPPPEFSNYMAEREQEKKAPLELVPAPAWAVEAAAPTDPLTPPPRRNFLESHERVWDGDLVVIRQRGEDGHHTYRAFECGSDFRHQTAFVLGELTYGRIDTRRHDQPLDPYTDYVELIAWGLLCSAAAQAVIRKLCPETRLAAGESAPTAGVYEGPGYVLVTVDPEFRYRAARAREVPA